MQPQNTELDRESLRACSKISVSGLALVLSFRQVAEGDETTSSALEVEPQRRRLRKVVDKETGGTGDYALDSVRHNAGTLEVRLSYLPRRASASSLMSFRRDQMSDPETFINLADRVTEQVRRFIIPKLGDSDSNGACELRAWWTPGPGVEKIVQTESTAGAIQERIADLRWSVSRANFLAVSFLIGGMLFVIGGSVLGLAIRDAVVPLIGLLYGVIFFLGAAMGRTSVSQAQQNIAELSEVKDLQTVGNSAEKLARQLFRVNEIEVRRYYSQSLRQRAWVFIVGVVAIVAGFAAAAFSIHFVNSSKTAGLDQKIVIASLGTASAILANVVAVVFLRMFSEIVRSSTTFHNRLVLTHHVHYGNVLAASIKNDHTRDATLAEMAKALAHTTAESASTVGGASDSV